jgi:hypothetical protein
MTVNIEIRIDHPIAEIPAPLSDERIAKSLRSGKDAGGVLAGGRVAPRGNAGGVYSAFVRPGRPLINK